MKISMGDKNKIKNSNIGTSNKIVKEEEKSKDYFWQIIIGIVATVVGGIILYFITK